MSTAPRSHDEVPSWLPQPKLNLGVTLAGEAVSRTVASGTLPPCVQALTAHWADCPRLMVVCKRCTATQRLTCVVCAAIATADPEPGAEALGLPAVVLAVGAVLFHVVGLVFAGEGGADVVAEPGD